MYPGEYIQPLVRKTFVQVPVVSGYVAARLQAQDWIQPAISGFNAPNSAFGVLYENVGNTWFSVVLQVTNDRSVSGVRTQLPTTAASVCPGGMVAAISSTTARFLEVFCTGTTSGQLRMQMESQRQWTEMGFDKVDDAGLYPTSLWQAKEHPGPVTIP